MTLTEFWAIIGIAVGFVGYFPYLRDVVRGKTKPHVFSWLVWGTIMGIAGTAQWVDGAGAGAWATFATSFLCLVLVIFALWNRGDRHITRGDWISFVAAMLAIPLWLATGDPLWSVVLITLIDMIGFYPTWRKSMLRPHEETIFLYAMASIRSVVALMAMEHYSVVTMLYPASLVLGNGAFTLFLIWRRRVLHNCT